MILYLFLSFSITLVSVPLFMKLARKYGVVDRPDGILKTHSRPIPYLGGLGIFSGLVPAFLRDPTALVLVWIAAVLGFLDDLFDLPPKLRFAVEVAVSIGVVYRYVGFENWFYSLALIVAFTALINAVNMIDGMDGVCAGVAAISAMAFAVLAPNSLTLAISLSLIGSSVAYLFYNFPPARVFMGDAGSYTLGTTLAVLYASSVRGPDPNEFTLVFVFPLWIYGLDLLSGFVRRIKAGRSPFEGDRDHFYDKINRRVKSPRKTLIYVYSISALFSFLSLPCALGTIGCSVSIVVASITSFFLVKVLRLLDYD